MPVLSVLGIMVKICKSCCGFDWLCELSEVGKGDETGKEILVHLY